MIPFQVNAHRIKKSLGYLIALGIFFFLGRVLFLNWEALADNSWRFHMVWLSASFATLLMHLGLSVKAWLVVLRQLGVQLPYRIGFGILNLAQLGRYLPGKVWLFLGQVYLCKDAGIGTSEAVLSSILQLACLAFSGILISLFLLSFPSTTHLSLALQISILLTVVVAGTLIFALLRRKRLTVISAKIVHIDSPIRFSAVQLLYILLAYLALWCCRGLAFFLFVNSLFPLDWDKLPVMTGIYAASWTAGFLSFITPAGLGVREGVLTVMLSAHMPPTTAALVALLSRIWSIVADLVLAATAFWLRRQDLAKEAR